MANQIQVIGTLKCKDTQKVIRFFKERGVQVHFLDLNVKGISAGELNNIRRSIPLEDLLDKESKEFKRLNLQYMVYDPEQILLENSLLLKTPITRAGGKAILGFDSTKLNQLAKEK
jgi:arsenate reductase-like glutaredoxin family protein